MASLLAFVRGPLEAVRRRQRKCRRSGHLWARVRLDGCQATDACQRCGATRVSAVHEWEPPEYAEESVCRATRKCSKCGATEPLEAHVFPRWTRPRTHAEQVRAVTAEMVCSRCGYICDHKWSARSFVEEQSGDYFPGGRGVRRMVITNVYERTCNICGKVKQEFETEEPS